MLRRHMTFEEALAVTEDSFDAECLMNFINETVDKNGYASFSDLKYWYEELS